MEAAIPRTHRGASLYARLGIETSVNSASPHQLITMLFDGAAGAIAMARHHMLERRIQAKGESISKAINIVENGLKAALDASAGGEQGAHLVRNLGALYDYVARRLVYANLHDDVAVLDQCARLLEDVASAWREIGLQPQAAAPVPVDA